MAAFMLVALYNTTVTPSSGDQLGVSVLLTVDPRGYNGVINNEWNLDQDYDEPLYDW